MELPEIRFGNWRSADGLVWWEATIGPAALAFTTRLGGASDPPYDTLNLGLHVGDDPDAVNANRDALWSAVGHAAAAPVLAEQVHGAEAAVVGAADAECGWCNRGRAVPRTDALVTREPGIAPAILVADCAPVALVAPGGVLGVAHAGWRGLAGGVLEATLRQMAELGAGPAGQYQAVIGPCIRGCCYEVGEEVWSRFPDRCLTPSGEAHTRRLDMMAAVVDRLLAVGLPAGQIRSLGLCTSCHPELFFSHRRSTQQGRPTTGRMALFARLTG
jgi:YfiH family protein